MAAPVKDLSGGVSPSLNPNAAKVAKQVSSLFRLTLRQCYPVFFILGAFSQMKRAFVAFNLGK